MKITVNSRYSRPIATTKLGSEQDGKVNPVNTSYDVLASEKW